MKFSFRKDSFKFFMVCIAAFLVSISTSYAADTKLYKPFVMAKAPAGDFNAAVASTKKALAKAGFDIVGDYSPYKGAHVFAVTSQTILNIVKNEEVLYQISK